MPILKFSVQHASSPPSILLECIITLVFSRWEFRIHADCVFSPAPLVGFFEIVAYRLCFRRLRLQDCERPRKYTLSAFPLYLSDCKRSLGEYTSGFFLFVCSACLSLEYLPLVFPLRLFGL